MSDHTPPRRHRDRSTLIDAIAAEELVLERLTTQERDTRARLAALRDELDTLDQESRISPSPTVVDEVGGQRRHAPTATGRAKSSSLAREGDQHLARAARAAETGEATGHDAAAEESAQLPLDEARQPLAAAACPRLGEEARGPQAAALVADLAVVGVVGALALLARWACGAGARVRPVDPAAGRPATRSGGDHAEPGGEPAGAGSVERADAPRQTEDEPPGQAPRRYGNHGSCAGASCRRLVWTGSPGRR